MTEKLNKCIVGINVLKKKKKSAKNNLKLEELRQGRADLKNELAKYPSEENTNSLDEEEEEDL